MCGIAGIIDPKIENKKEVIESLVSKIIHRGPDDLGFFVDQNVGLGMRRLSIIDLSSGKQPITSMDEKLVIFFNGEIYNYKELKDELLKNGHKFKTNTDTEVILRLYELEGEKMLTKLRGMFAFSIYNIETKEIFIARDFFGIKPLYYLMEGEKIRAFGSEIKCLLVVPNFKTEINHNAVLNYLSFQYNPLTETFFKNIYKLLPGHFMKIKVDTGEKKIERYWSFQFDQKDNLDKNKTISEIRNTIEDSVSHHMIADVPVGSFLSGGVDSSIIATMMQKVRGDSKIKTFTVGFDSLTEGVEAKETSSFLNTDHTEIKVSKEEYFKILPKAVYHFDEPVADPSAIGLYFVAREAKKHVKVVLSGEGADELFGGYNIYLAPLAKARMMWLPKSILNIFLSIPFEYFGKNYFRRVSRKLEDWYIGNATIFSKNEIYDLVKNSNLSELENLSLKPLYKNVENLSESTQMQYIDINTWLVGDILAKADKMTMANSLELRVPFLDIKVSDLAKTLPDAFKWHSGTTKYLLREAFKEVIPESTRNRKKLGFPTPIRNWLTKDNEYVWDTIQNNEYIKSNMNMGFIKKLIDDHTSKKVDNSRKIYLLLMLALWYDVYINKEVENLT